MSSVAAPYGAEPIGTLSASGSFTGKVRAIPIASGYATAIFYGDFVKLEAAGVVQKDGVSNGTVNATHTPVGIFMGCEYTDPNTGYLMNSQYWPAGTVASNAKAFVLDDPDVLFKMQGDDTIAATALGSNFATIGTAGSTAVGRSKNAVDASSTAATNSLPLRLIDFVFGPDSAPGDAYTDVICKFNAGHQYFNTTGV
jgi:hypothetical protein